MRVTCLKPFYARRDKATDRQLLTVGEQVTIDDNDPHLATLLKDGFAAEVKPEAPAKAAKADKASA